MTMADTVAVMNRGVIEQIGAPEELYDLPTTAFVANFLGQSNLFSGAVTAEDAEVIVVDVAGLKVAVPKARSQRHTGEVTIGVRPEKLRIHTSRPAAAAGVNILGPGHVTDVSFTGVSTQYTVLVPGIGRVIVFAQNAGGGQLVAQGAEVWVSWEVDHGFGLIDEPEDAGRFADDVGTAQLAVQTKEELIEELGEA